MLREESGEALLKFSALKVTGSLTYLAGDTADYEHLVSAVFPRLRERDIKALIDALQLARRAGVEAVT